MFLLDTDVIIYSLKGRQAILDSLRTHRHLPMAVSAITYGELVFGAAHSQHRTENLSRVHRIAEIYPVLPVTQAIMDAFGDIKATLRRTGTPVDDFDLVIAATALSHGLTLVTHNTRHFQHIPGLALADWL